MSTTPAPVIEANPEATTLCGAFQATALANADDIAIRNGDGTVEFTWREYAARVESIAAGLANLGVRPGDTVGLLMNNDPMFHLLDTAALHLGAIPFSMYQTLAVEQLEHVFDNAGCNVVVAQEAFVPKLLETRADKTTPEHLVCIDGKPEGTVTLEAIEAAPDPDFDFAASWQAVQPDDVATLIYTSGTTGPPKGVELTHASLLSQCRQVAGMLDMRPGDTITSYLPSAHIADRWSAHYNQIVFGLQVTSVDNPSKIVGVLNDLRPTLWGGVPRVIEKLKAALEAAVAAEPDPDKKAAMTKAIEVGIARTRLLDAGEEVPPELAAAHEQLDAAVLSQFRAKLGLDRARWVVVGAAPLSRDVQEFMLGIGLPIVEIYGMSETSCAITASSPAEARIGSVGKPIPDIETRIEEDGELLGKGPTLMRGYRNQPDKTAETIDDDGWLHTGDIAEVDDDGYVRIVDRKKELIINAAGKNMSPANIERVLKGAHPMIGQAVVIGDGRRYNTALVVLDPDLAKAHAAAQGLADDSVAGVAADPGVRAAMCEAIGQANQRLARVEQIKRFALLPEEWLPGGDELTPTSKLKRKPISAKYEGVVESLYAEDGSGLAPTDPDQTNGDPS